MICFVIAMAKEAEPIISAVEIERDIKICGKRVIIGKLYKKSAGIVVCGVGKVNAAMGAQIAVTELGATEIINIGVAGGLNNSVRVGEIYGIGKAVQYDFDLAEINGTEIGTLDECQENYLPLAVSEIYPVKNVATGDRFNDSKADFTLLTETLKADIRDMECGAIAQVCMHADVPFRAFKIISDVAGSGSTFEQYKSNLKLCFNTLERELENIVKSSK